MSETPHEIVARGYDVVADDYANLEGAVEWPRMRWLRKSSRSCRRDRACWTSVVDRASPREHDVVGVDVSARQIELARRNVPGAEFIHGDIETLDLPPASFDAVVAFYVLDHLSRESHEVASTPRPREA